MEERKQHTQIMETMDKEHVETISFTTFQNVLKFEKYECLSYIAYTNTS